MVTSATSSPLITVEKLVVNQAQGLLTVELAQQGLESFNATCQEQPMPFEELVNVMLIAKGFGATSLTAVFNIGQAANEKFIWTLNVEASSARQTEPTPQTPPYQLTARQQANAEHVLIEAVGDLAKRGHEGKDLNTRAISLAASLRAGLGQLQHPELHHDQPNSAAQR